MDDKPLIPFRTAPLTPDEMHPRPASRVLHPPFGWHGRQYGTKVHQGSARAGIDAAKAEGIYKGKVLKTTIRPAVPKPAFALGVSK